MQYVVVFDTNILISALLSTRSSPFRCLTLAKLGQLQSITCPEILAEFAEKLATKFKFSPEMVQAAIAEVEDFSQSIAIDSTLKAVPDDPDDDMVIECAVVGQATHIVTGDKHLLALGHYQAIQIVKAAELLALLTPD